LSIKDAVIDSSIIVAVLTPEKYSEWADETLGRIDKWISIDLIYYEIANTIWKKYLRLKILKRDEAYEALDKALKTLNNLFIIYSYDKLIKEAFEVAEKSDITVYDAAYLVLAERLETKLVTLDEKLYKKLKNTEHAKTIIAPVSLQRKTQ
jgi:predicted nucleic acid-binding protein